MVKKLADSLSEETFSGLFIMGVLLAMIIVAMLRAGGGNFSDQYHQDFVQGCRKDAPAEYCECAYQEIKKRYDSPAQVPEKITPELLDISRTCGGKEA